MRINRLLCTIVLTLLVASFATQAQDFKFGVKGGLTFGKLVWDKSKVFNKYDSEGNQQRLGFNVGLTVQYIGRSGLGIDLSAMYARTEYGYWDYDRINKNMMDIPLHLTFHLPLGFRSKFSPYIYTGPDLMVSLNRARKLYYDDYYYYNDTRSVFSWDVGLGMMILGRFQLQGGYSFGISNTFEGENGTAYGKGRVWQLSAAVVF